MGMGKLNKAQIEALKVLPVTITMWGGRPFAGMPKGVSRMPTLYALLANGHAKRSFNGRAEYWFITPAGRQALQEGGRMKTNWMHVGFAASIVIGIAGVTGYRLAQWIAGF